MGAALPLLVILVALATYLSWTISNTFLLFPAALGGLAAYVGGSSALKAAARAMFWGVLAMALSAVAGTFFNVTP